MSVGAVLGIDLGSRRWRDNGAALLRWSDAAWTDVRTRVLPWPTLALDARTMCDAITTAAQRLEVAAVSLDGPQAWRDPELPGPGVGRRCEYETRTPGKTGAFSRCYPGTWSSFVRFSIELFDRLLQTGHFVLLSSGEARDRDASGRVALLECFPTCTWRSSGLEPLPAKSRSTRSTVLQFSTALQQRYSLPAGALTDQHDELQAIVAAVTAAAAMGGPCVSIAHGVPSTTRAAAGPTPAHRVEGVIWDAAPRSTTLPVARISAPPARDHHDESGPQDENNPLLPDPRDDASDEALARGVSLFEYLVQRTNAGDPTGIGYASFVERVHGAPFATVAGHSYRPSDSRWVIRLATLVTEAAGGRRPVTRHGATLEAGMDTFIWQTSRPHDRSPRAWTVGWATPPYTRESWRRVFRPPRRLIRRDEP